MTHTQLAAADHRVSDRHVRPTFREDLGRAIPDALVALLLTGVVFAVFVARVHSGADPALLEMPSMARSGGIWPYSLSQAFGWAALLWSWLTILLGVSLPIWGRRGRTRMHEIVERLHRSSSVTVIGLMVGHAALLAWDKMGDNLVTIFVPWTTSYLPGRFPQTLGILSFYLAIVFGLSFYLRDRIGLRVWRLLHRYLIPIVYILAVWHTFLYGSDMRAHNALWFAVWGLQAPIAGAFIARLFVAARSSA